MNIKIEDLNKLYKTISLSKSPSTFTLEMDGHRLRFLYIGDDGKLITITLFDAETSSTPTITKTDFL